MAAAIMNSSRCFSRSFSSFTAIRQQVKAAQVRAVCRSKHSSSRECRVSPAQCLTQVLCRTQPSALSRNSTYVAAFRNIRGFRTSPAFCEEVRTVGTPQFADSVTEGDIRWEKAVGDSVAEDEIVGEIETDKTSLPVPAPAAGVIEELLVEDGATIQANTPLFKIRIGGEGAAPAAAKPADDAPKAAAPPPAEAPAPTPAAPSAGAGPIPTSPPPAPPVPTAPISAKPTSAVKPIPAAAAPAGAAVVGARTETRERMTKIRKRIAERLKDAQNTCAMLTTFNEIDMSNIMEMRKKHQDAFVKKHGIKVGFMSAFVKASAAALQAIPAVNGAIDQNEIIYRDFVDISVAVATPKGLVVPVIRNAETLTYAGIEKYIGELGEKARAGTLAIEDMDGGTFTISNGGVFGSLMGTPIINPPQSAILGMHGVFERPVAIAGKVEIRPMMYVALTYDHRLIDGREAVTFLRKIKAAVEDPRVLLLDL